MCDVAFWAGRNGRSCFTSGVPQSSVPCVFVCSNMGEMYHPSFLKNNMERQNNEYLNNLMDYKDYNGSSQFFRTLNMFGFHGSVRRDQTWTLDISPVARRCNDVALGALALHPARPLVPRWMLKGEVLVDGAMNIPATRYSECRVWGFYEPFFSCKYGLDRWCKQSSQV